MADLILITDFSNNYSENLLKVDSMLTGAFSVNYNAYGPGFYSFESVNNISKIANAIKFENSQDIVGGIDTQFDFGTALSHVAIKDGRYIFSFGVDLIDKTANPDYDVNIKLKVFKNGTLYDSYTYVYLFSDFFAQDSISTFGQSFNVLKDDVLNFTFEIEKPSVGTPNPSFTFAVGGFKLEVDDKNLGIPTPYSLPIDYVKASNATGWQSRKDASNNQFLTNGVDNLISFTGSLLTGGSLALLDVNAKIKPLAVKDLLIVNFDFTAISPTISNNFLTVFLKVNGVVYRAKNLNFTKVLGADNYFSVSWSLPVDDNFFTYGGSIYINPDADISITNRYINCVRTHKAIF